MRTTYTHEVDIDWKRTFRFFRNYQPRAQIQHHVGRLRNNERAKCVPVAEASRFLVPCLTQWEAIPGSYNLHYYFNPKTYVMQWSHPAGAVICKVTKTKTSKKRVAGERGHVSGRESL